MSLLSTIKEKIYDLFKIEKKEEVNEPIFKDVVKSSPFLPIITFFENYKEIIIPFTFILVYTLSIIWYVFGETPGPPILLAIFNTIVVFFTILIYRNPIFKWIKKYWKPFLIAVLAVSTGLYSFYGDGDGPVPIPKASAQTTEDQGATANQDLNTGGDPWNSETNVYNNDSNAAYCQIRDSDSEGDTLRLYDFDFSTESDDYTLTGIEVTLRCYTTSTQTLDDAFFSQVRITNTEGSAIGEDKSGDYSPGTDPEYFTMGGQYDMWGTSLTSTDVRDVDFGVRIRATSDSDGFDAMYIRYAEITCYYNNTPPTVWGDYHGPTNDTSFTSSPTCWVRIDDGLETTGTVYWHESDDGGSTWRLTQVNTSVSMRSTNVTYDYTNASSPGTYHWKVELSDGSGQPHSNYSYYFNIVDFNITKPSPYQNSDVVVTYRENLTCFVANCDSWNISVYANQTGTIYAWANDSGLGSYLGEINCPIELDLQYNKSFWWDVSIQNSEGGWKNKTFYFQCFDGSGFGLMDWCYEKEMWDVLYVEDYEYYPEDNVSDVIFGLCDHTLCVFTWNEDNTQELSSKDSVVLGTSERTRTIESDGKYIYVGCGNYTDYYGVKCYTFNASGNMELNYVDDLFTNSEYYTIDIEYYYHPYEDADYLYVLANNGVADRLYVYEINISGGSWAYLNDTAFDSSETYYQLAIGWGTIYVSFQDSGDRGHVESYTYTPSTKEITESAYLKYINGTTGRPTDLETVQDEDIMFWTQEFSKGPITHTWNYRDDYIAYSHIEQEEVIEVPEQANTVSRLREKYVMVGTNVSIYAYAYAGGSFVYKDKYYNCTDGTCGPRVDWREISSNTDYMFVCSDRGLDVFIFDLVEVAPPIINISCAGNPAKDSASHDGQIRYINHSYNNETFFNITVSSYVPNERYMGVYERTVDDSKLVATGDLYDNDRIPAQNKYCDESNHTILANKITCTYSGEYSSISAYLIGSGQYSCNTSYSIWSHDEDNDCPDSLLAETEVRTFGENTMYYIYYPDATQQWFEIPLKENITLIEGNEYWILVATNDSSYYPGSMLNYNYGGDELLDADGTTSYGSGTSTISDGDSLGTAYDSDADGSIYYCDTYNLGMWGTPYYHHFYYMDGWYYGYDIWWDEDNNGYDSGDTRLTRGYDWSNQTWGNPTNFSLSDGIYIEGGDEVYSDGEDIYYDCCYWNAWSNRGRDGIWDRDYEGIEDIYWVLGRNESTENMVRYNSYNIDEDMTWENLNTTHQPEDWSNDTKAKLLCVHATAEGVYDEPIGLHHVDLEWWNGTTWKVYELDRIGSTDEYYYNLTGLEPDIWYTFNVTAYDDFGNKLRSQFFRWMSDNVTERIKFKCAEPIDWADSNETTDLYDQNYILYLWNATYDNTSDIFGDGEDRENILRHEQGVDGTNVDTGYWWNRMPPNATDPQIRQCTKFAGGWWDYNITIEDELDIENMYIHWWTGGGSVNNSMRVHWGQGTSVYDFVWLNAIGQPYGYKEMDSQIAAHTTAECPMADSHNYYGGLHQLWAEKIDFNTSAWNGTAWIPIDNSFDSLSIYNLFFGLDYNASFAWGLNAQLYNSRDYLTYTIFNVPDNTTLNTSGPGGHPLDTDGDNLTDWEELYVNYTNPFIADTDNDSVWDSDDGQPNHPDYIVPVLSNITPSPGSLTHMHALDELSVNISTDGTFDWTIEGGWGNTSSGTGTTGIKTCEANYDWQLEDTYTWWINMTNGIWSISKEVNFTAVIIYNHTIDLGTDEYFTWLGENVSAWEVGNRIDEFDSVSDMLSIVNDNTGHWDNYTGDDSGVNWTVHTFDVLRIITDGSGTENFEMGYNVGMAYSQPKTFTIVPVGALNNYTCWTNSVSTTLSAINSTIFNSPDDDGYYLALYNDTTNNFNYYICGFGCSGSNCNKDVHQWDVIFVRPRTTIVWDQT